MISYLRCIIIPETSIQDLKSYNELIADVVTSRLVLRDTEKTEETLGLEIKNKLKELEQEKINELKLLEEEIFFMTLRNKYLGRSSHIIKQEEIDLKEGVDRIEFQNAKTLEDLNFLKHEKAAAISEIEQKLIRFGISKELINFFKKSIIPKRYLHLVSEEQVEKYIMLNY